MMKRITMMPLQRRRAIEKAIANTVKFRRFWRTKVKPKEVDLTTWDCGTTACLGGWAERFFEDFSVAFLFGVQYTYFYPFGGRRGPSFKSRLAQGKADWREGDDRLTENLQKLRRLLKP